MFFERSLVMEKTNAYEKISVEVLEKRVDLLSERVNMDIYEQRKHLLGKVLTVIDASISDPEQRKAAKDLINNAWYEGSYWNFINNQFKGFLGSFGISSQPDAVLQGPHPTDSYSKIKQ
jgi:hypothetical protein